MSQENLSYDQIYYNCEKCNWKGIALDALTGDLHTDYGIQLFCPKCSNLQKPTAIGYVHKDYFKLFANLPREQFEKQIEKHPYDRETLLTKPNQLPHFNGKDITIVLSEKTIDGIDYIIFSAFGQEIWREKMEFRYLIRLIEIIEIFELRYGASLRDVVPNVSGYNLYGQSPSAMKKLEHIRLNLLEEFYDRESSEIELIINR